MVVCWPSELAGQSLQQEYLPGSLRRQMMKVWFVPDLEKSWCVLVSSA